MLVDTHAHLYLDRFDDDREAVLHRAREAGVGAIVLPAIDTPSIEQAVALAEAHADVFAMTGLHPSSTEDAAEADMATVADWCDHEQVVAIGESGLDYYWDRSFDDRQKHFFRMHIRLAIETGLPLVIHNREATNDVLAILAEERAAHPDGDRLHGILHCFVDDADTAQRAWELGFYVGIGGIVTFKNSDHDAMLRATPLEHIVLETDAPYLAPQAERGHRNEPAFVKHVAEYLAAVTDHSLQTIVETTTANAQSVYDLPAPVGSNQASAAETDRP